MHICIFENVGLDIRAPRLVHTYAGLVIFTKQIRRQCNNEPHSEFRATDCHLSGGWIIRLVRRAMHNRGNLAYWSYIVILQYKSVRM